jgi:tetratricopeptide (TPR) repeat protein
MLSDSIMRSLAGQRVTLPANDFSTWNDKLLYGELLLTQLQFADAGLALASATNSSTSPDEIGRIADSIFALRELDAAEAAYHRLDIFPGHAQRAQLGVAAVLAARNDASANLNAADAHFAAKQYKQSGERYRTALCANPHMAGARIGLAESLERGAVSAENPAGALRNAIYQYQCYLALSPGLMLREHDRLEKRIVRLQDAVAQIDHDPRSTAIKGLLERLSSR